MKALCVDDEAIPLRSLKKAVERSPKVSEVTAFDDESDALDWAKEHPVDVAFLDIELHEMNGLELAQQLLRIHPQTAIVFCTSYEQYALRAIKMHIDAGYLVKPFRPKQVLEEIDHIAETRAYKRRLKVNCFGDFDVLVDGQPLEFKRGRTKEVFAYLVDRRGAEVSTNEILAALWEDENDEKKRDYLYHLISDLKNTLDAAGFDEVFRASKAGYSIDPNSIDCDYYRMLDGDDLAKRHYTGEYMIQYSWAEYTNSWLEGLSSRLKP